MKLSNASFSPSLLLLISLGGVVIWLLKTKVEPFQPDHSAATDAQRANAASAQVLCSPPDASDSQGGLRADLTQGSFLLAEGGTAQRFRVSLHELYLPEAPVGRRLVQIRPQPDAAHLAAEAKKAAGPGSSHGAGWVLYPQGAPDTPALRRVLHSHLLLKVRSEPAAKASLAAHDLRLLDEPAYAPGHWIVEPKAGGPEATLAALDVLASDPAFEAAEPLLLQFMEKKGVPNDPLFAEQWHLQNTGLGGGKAGSDAGVTSVWDTYQGQGIRIGIVDDGLDLQHPDLIGNVDSANHYDWSDSPFDTNPAPSAANGDYHGTSVGGVAGARGGNGVGVSGVAPKATLVGFRLIADDVTDAKIADAMTRNNHLIQVKNNSWGRPDGYPWIMYAPGRLTTAAMKTAATTGRGGLGTVLVWAAGNGRASGDQGNKDSSANSIYSIAVGALTNRGALSSYSETGSHIAVVAPSSGGSRQAVTTDLPGAEGYNKYGDKGQLSDLDYTNTFGGTSSAAPVVSGVVALMLEANPLLNWRDVKEILLRSSTQLFPTNSGWTSRTGGAAPTVPLLKHHHSYGGGLVNAMAAVEMAETWSSLGPLQEVSRSQTWSSPGLEIPDNKASGVAVPFDFENAQPMRVEQVTVTVDIRHRCRGDLHITLKSPAGVVSTLASKEARDDGENYANWTFSSVRHWGESGRGKWQLHIRDAAAEDIGRIRSANLTLFGTAASPVQITSQPAAASLVAVGESLTLTVGTAGFGHTTHQWRRGSTKVGTDAAFTVAACTAAHAGTYQVTTSNLTGSETSTAATVGVVQRQLAPVIVNEGATLNLKATATGSSLAYQWYRGDHLLVNDDRISGAQTAALTVKNISLDDQAGYVCRISFMESDVLLDTLPAAVTVRLKPVIVPPPLITNSVVSGMPMVVFGAENSATRFSATGLPPGVTMNAKDGTLSGRPTKAGTYHIKVAASNLAGTSDVWTHTWTIENFPAQAAGAYSGLVDRQASVNSGMGGRFAMAITTSGSFSGTLGLGAKSYPLTGRIHALPSEADPVTSVVISRAKPLPPVTLTFTVHLATGLLDGTVTVDGQECALAARRSPWTKTDPAPAGAFTSILEAAEVAEILVPEGEGFALLNVTSAGVATWTGKLADGSSITGGATVAEAGQVPLHLMLYAGTGSVQGWAEIGDAELLDGQLTWIKDAQPPKSTTRSYRAGFPLHGLTLAGGRYAKPSSGVTAMGLATSSGDLANAQVQFSGGGLAAAMVQDFAITPAHAVKLPLGVLNPQKVKLRLNAATGLLSGSFTLQDNDPTDTLPPIAVITRSVPFNGVIITRAGASAGRGHFLLPSLPVTKPSPPTPVLSGKFLFKAMP